MKKIRFFATLQYARKIGRDDKVLYRLLLTQFMYAFTCGWQEATQYRTSVMQQLDIERMGLKL